MIITNKDQLDNACFSPVEKLLDCVIFTEFEEKNDHLIFYADGEKESVVNAMSKEFHANPFKCVEFDGWYIALLHI